MDPEPGIWRVGRDRTAGGGALQAGQTQVRSPPSHWDETEVIGDLAHLGQHGHAPAGVFASARHAGLSAAGVSDDGLELASELHGARVLVFVQASDDMDVLKHRLHARRFGQAR